MKITLDNTHIFVPLVDGEGGENSSFMVKIADLPQMPFQFPGVEVKRDEGASSSSSAMNAVKLSLTPTKATEPRSSKLPTAGRTQSLAHINRRRKSVSARCA